LKDLFEIVWRKFLADVAPAFVAVDWDIVHVAVRSDLGQVFVSCRKSSLIEVPPGPRCTVAIPALRKWHMNIWVANKHGYEERRKLFDEGIDSWANVISDAAHVVGLLNLICRPGVRLIVEKE
jgi:hypothetical protein